MENRDRALIRIRMLPSNAFSEFLATHGLLRLSDAFRGEGLTNINDLRLLKPEDMTELGMNIGEKRRLEAALDNTHTLTTNDTIGVTALPSAPNPLAISHPPSQAPSTGVMIGQPTQRDLWSNTPWKNHDDWIAERVRKSKRQKKVVGVVVLALILAACIVWIIWPAIQWNEGVGKYVLTSSCSVADYKRITDKSGCASAVAHLVHENKVPVQLTDDAVDSRDSVSFPPGCYLEHEVATYVSDGRQEISYVFRYNKNLDSNMSCHDTYKREASSTACTPKRPCGKRTSGSYAFVCVCALK